jgi:hypothetical protein
VPPPLLARADESSSEVELIGIRFLDFWWDNDTVKVIRLPIEFERSTNVKSKVRCRQLQDFAGRYGYPRAIHLHLVVAIDLSP